MQQLFKLFLSLLTHIFLDESYLFSLNFSTSIIFIFEICYLSFSRKETSFRILISIIVELDRFYFNQNQISLLISLHLFFLASLLDSCIISLQLKEVMLFMLSDYFAFLGIILLFQCETFILGIACIGFAIFNRNKKRVKKQKYSHMKWDSFKE